MYNDQNQLSSCSVNTAKRLQHSPKKAADNYWFSVNTLHWTEDNRVKRALNPG